MVELIPVVNEASMLGGGVQAILAEIVAMLENLATSGAGGQIDIRSVPLSPTELDTLKYTLGKGEATIELSLGGPSRCEETAFPGVWWVRHMNPEGDVVAELIEVAEVPNILAYDDDELLDGIESLSLRLPGRGT